MKKHKKTKQVVVPNDPRIPPDSDTRDDEIRQLKELLAQHYRGTTSGQFGFAPTHKTIEKGVTRWL